jgi:hypothetical protein
VTDQRSEASSGPVSTDTKVTAVFVVLALVSVAGTTTVTDTQWVHFAVLLGVGVVVPTVINEWRG